MMMKYQLKFPQLAEALYLALSSDAFYCAMEASVAGSHQIKKQAMLAYMDYSITEAQCFGECFIPKKQHYGVSVWSKPISHAMLIEKNKAKKVFIKQNMGEKSYFTYEKICNEMSNNAKNLISCNDWYLSIIGVLPAFQGQGLGPGLVQQVLKKIDEHQVSTYLETFTERNMTFYFRLGYETLDCFVEPVTQAKYWLMRRRPLLEV